MNNKPTETNSNQVAYSSADLVLNDDEIEQLVKFLDALLESDLSSRENVGNGND